MAIIVEHERKEAAERVARAERVAKAEQAAKAERERRKEAERLARRLKTILSSGDCVINYINKNYTKTSKWCHQAAEQGNTLGQYKLGVMYQYGRGVAQNDTEAAKWFRKVADQGNPLAKYALENL